MNISCEGISKKYRQETLFKGFNHTFIAGKQYAILGPNSSGKSTLLKIVAGILDANEGEVKLHDNKDIERDSWYGYYAYSSPELLLFSEFTVAELFDFHFGLKKCKLSKPEFYEVTGLKKFRNKRFEDLSSGLKNKLKISLAMFSDTPALFLDEPCTNFDDVNTQWYREMIEKYCSKQLLIIASNKKEEYDFCNDIINVTDYKTL